MEIKSIKNVKNLSGKTVLLRVDFNVPLEKGIIKDDSRIISALPDIKYLLTQNCRILIAGKLKILICKSSTLGSYAYRVCG